MKVRDLIAWLSQRDPDENISLAGSRLAELIYADRDERTDEDSGVHNDGRVSDG